MAVFPLPRWSGSADPAPIGAAGLDRGWRGFDRDSGGGRRYVLPYCKTKEGQWKLAF